MSRNPTSLLHRLKYFKVHDKDVISTRNDKQNPEQENYRYISLQNSE